MDPIAQNIYQTLCSATINRNKKMQSGNVTLIVICNKCWAMSDWYLNVTVLTGLGDITIYASRLLHRSALRYIAYCMTLDNHNL